MKKLLLLALFLLPNVSHAAFPTYSVLLNGSSQYGSVADNAAFDTTTAYTIEAWIKFNTIPTTNGALMFVFNKDDGAPNRSIAVGLRRLDPNDTMYALVSQTGENAESNNYHIAAADIATGSWKHYAWVFNIGAGTEYEAFIDGVSQGTAAVAETGIFSSGANVEVGAAKYGAGAASSFVDGRIGLMRVWKSARTATQLSDNWCTVLGSTTNLVSEWTFDNTLNDNSGNSLTLTDTGTMTFATDIPSICPAPAATPTSILAAILDWFDS